ncbi:hypothetical protein PPYR_05206 [Photinus pyralis]|uniref:RNA-directed DNA polymerase n=2 Tax=Photinus pyralis TaxID=7054 RepID=A0A5N4B0T5_PHOPY|nr:hypothetical protein PPYR_05206 [Photinus pyralis]
MYRFYFPALVDTGSEICAISEQVWSQLGDYHHKIASISSSGIKVSGAFKSKQRRVKQQSLITCQVLGNEFNFEFLLIPELVYPVIIGNDLLRSWCAKVDLGAQQVFLKINDKWVAVPEIKHSHELTNQGSLEMRPIKHKAIQLLCVEEGVNYGPSDEQLSAVVDQCKLSSSEKIVFRELLEEHRTLFSEKPGRTQSYAHEIRLKDKREFFKKQYPVALAHREAIQNQLNLMVQWGVIQRCATPYINPIMTTLKKDNSVRVCLDARHLNSVMEREYETPLPIEEIVRNIPSFKYMSTFDFTHGYWQIPLTEESKKYTGFRFDGKTYVFCTLPFGLSTSVSAFVRCLNSVFGDDFRSFLVLYVDDGLVTSQSFDEHIAHLDKVFSRLREANFTLRLNKCSFFRQEVPYLGYILNCTGIKPDPNRVQAVIDYAVPRNVKEIQKFLGLVNYDRAFCPELSSAAAPLNKLCRKNVAWQWTATEQNALESLKEKIRKATLLYHPRENLPFGLSTDASDIGLGAQLFQTVNGERHVVAWASRMLHERETRYTTYERELLALVWALGKFRIYLLGKQFTVFTDNSSLTYIKTCRLLSARIARYALAIQEYDFTIEHIPGSKNVVADALSRYAAVRPPSPSDRLFKILPLLRLSDELTKSLKTITQAQAADKKLGDIMKNFDRDPKLQQRFIIYNNALYIRKNNEEYYLLCVPNSLTFQFVRDYHERLGHFGAYKTWRALKSELWWNNMSRDVKRYIQGCEICQKTKHCVMSNPPLRPIVPKTKGELVALDLYGPLPTSRGGVTFILVLLDVFTKYVKFYALKKATTRSCLNRIIKSYFVDINIPKNILSDHGTQFKSPKWKESLESFNIKVKFSSVRHPQSNPSERIMKELGRMCRAYCADQHTRWAYELANFENLLNSVIHETTGFSPIELQFGSDRAKLLPKNKQGPVNEKITVERKIVLARESMESKAARRAVANPGSHFQEFEEGDYVLLRANVVSSAIKAETKKFMLLFEGPYKIKKSVSYATYVIVDPVTLAERGTFHASHLKKFYNPMQMQ